MVGLRTDKSRYVTEKRELLYLEHFSTCEAIRMETRNEKIQRKEKLEYRGLKVFRGKVGQLAEELGMEAVVRSRGFDKKI